VPSHRNRRAADRVRRLRPAPRLPAAEAASVGPAASVSLLVVGGPEDEGRSVAAVLSEAGASVRVTHACDRDELLQALDERPWDALIVGRGAGATDVRWLVGVLQERGMAVPCIVLGDVPDPRAALTALQAGAADYVDLAGGAWVRILPALERAGRFTDEQVARRRAEARWAETDRLYRIVAESAGDLICLHRPDATCAYASPSAAWLLGQTPEELLGTGFLDRVHPDDVARVRAALGRAGGGGEAVSVTHRVRRRLGDEVWMQTLAQVVAPGIAPSDWVQTVSRDVTERRALEDQLAHLALHDALTGLPNRALFMDRLTHALGRLKRRKGTLAVLFLDIDAFQLINDSLGRAAGDQLLAAAAERLRSGLRPGDTVARVGGDEFTVLLDDVRDGRDAARVAGRVAEALAAPFPVDGIDVFVTASVGIAVAAARGELAEDIVRNADVAMCQAKQRGRGQQEVFAPEVHGGGGRPRLQLEGELHRALQRGELRIHYQPALALDRGRVVAAEALLRWEHPTRGLLQPAAFLPVAEETGLIVPIGQWVLTAVCEQAEAWRRRFGPRAVPPLAINLSAGELAQMHLADDVRAALAGRGLPPAAIRLEVRLATLSAGAWSALGELAAGGVPVLLDDFGSAATSLGDLGRIPLAGISIDRGIVQALGQGGEAAAVIRTVVALGRALSVGVGAEGVETEAQAATVRELGCAWAQGFHFARPLPADGFAALLAATREGRGRTRPA
jgi:diguanylate cyclase (GGDEF)-like protein/PAS domain S-box-containing protein